ncbi:MAG: hypothetical protein KF861_03760 [Planctomycetaceae bacterium]|nr:hypothetical protein [Planctomycetaceae bacterium]
MRHSRMFLIGVLMGAALFRAGVATFWPENLHQDRDIYMALAEGIAAGRGFSVPGSEVPTAYRPPLYRACSLSPGQHIRSGTGLPATPDGGATVYLTYRLRALLGCGQPIRQLHW